MSWAANRLDELVHYYSEVVEVVPVRDGARVEHRTAGVNRSAPAGGNNRPRGRVAGQ